MKRKTLKRSSREKTKMKNSVSRHLTVQLGQVSLLPFQHYSSSSSNHHSRFQKPLESEVEDGQGQHHLSLLPLDVGIDANVDDKDFILSQDFFCTPDYITPDGQQILNSLDYNKENIPCPKSPEKLNTAKRQIKDDFSLNPLYSNLPCNQQVVELGLDTFESDELKADKASVTASTKKQSYVSQSAIALRYRVMPPPCIKNPYVKGTAEMEEDPRGTRRPKSIGIFSSVVGGDGLSRYRLDFHEIEQIGYGNFSRVFKVLKRIDGCMYAVKHSIKQLHQDMERKQALMEVQALAALGCHENIVGYYTSWFENEQLYIQMELCDQSLSINRSYKPSTEGEVLDVMHQIAKALQFIHERGIAHLDVKPDNIYVKNGIYKLGDFGCATLMDRTLPIEEGDARYMPQEILNEKYEHLGKVDIFSLGVAIYELSRGSPLPDSGPQLMNLREGKLPLLPGHSVQFQNLIKLMMDPDPLCRPSAKELVENPIFNRVQRTARAK